METFPALVSGNSNSIQFPVQGDWPFWQLYVNRSLPISSNIPSIFKVIKYWTQSNKYDQVNQDFGGCGFIKSLWRKISFGFYSDPPPPSPVLEGGQELCYMRVQAFWVVSTGTEVRWVVASWWPVCGAGLRSVSEDVSGVLSVCVMWAQVTLAGSLGCWLVVVSSLHLVNGLDTGIPTVPVILWRVSKICFFSGLCKWNLAPESKCLLGFWLKAPCSPYPSASPKVQDSAVWTEELWAGFNSNVGSVTLSWTLSFPFCERGMILPAVDYCWES